MILGAGNSEVTVRDLASGEQRELTLAQGVVAIREAVAGRAG